MTFSHNVISDAARAVSGDNMNVTPQCPADYWYNLSHNYPEVNHSVPSFPVKEEEYFDSCRFTNSSSFNYNHTDLNQYLPQIVNHYQQPGFYHEESKHCPVPHKEETKEEKDPSTLRLLLSQPLPEKAPPDNYPIVHYQNNNTKPPEEDYKNVEGSSNNSDDNISDTPPVYPWMKPHGK